jgi:predicted enzyme related to lactoylglutathione lyase
VKTLEEDIKMEMKIELIPVPVTDVDRSKNFYVNNVGFNEDHDHKVNENLRFIQLTPPGSACSIVLGNGITTMQPGSVNAYQMVVKDVRKIREHLLQKGVPVSEVDEQPWGLFVRFSDPDGNMWSLQQLPVRS